MTKKLTSMADKTSKTKPRRLPKGHRKHVRRLKQAARKAGIAYSRPESALHPSRVPKKEDHA
jgi:signal recognition particle subunit SEC65